MASCPMRANTPPNFTPPYEAFEAKYKDDSKPLIAAVLGVQLRSSTQDAQSAALKSLLSLAQLDNGPVNIEQGWHNDTAGAHTRIVFAYWRDAASFSTWRSCPDVAQWLARATDTTGHFIESAQVMPRGLDTLIAHPVDNWGLAKLADNIVVTPYHAYWGGTRDRILMSETDALKNPDGSAITMPDAKAAPAGLGQIVDVRLPHHAVMARGGPDWSKCAGAERLEFCNSVYPAYVAGGIYLRDNPEDAGCFAAYLVQETNSQGRDIERNHLIAYFAELSHIERWTKSHPTHVAIYQRFLKMLGAIGRMPDVNLYHEVSVIADGGLNATYANCLPTTGLLRFGTVRS